MKFVGPKGETLVPHPKAEPTQALLGEVYERLDVALDLLECVYQATQAPDHTYEVTAPLRAVLSEAQSKIGAAKDRLHDTIAWVT